MRAEWMILALALAPVLTPARPPSPEEAAAEKTAIAKAIDERIGWFATKDFDRLYEVFADDPDLFLFHPTSDATVHGIDAFRKTTAVWRDPQDRYLRHEVRYLRIHLHSSGQAAWFSAILDNCGEFSGRVGCWRDTRWTGVLEKRQGRWVVMQMHFSFAAERVLAGHEKLSRAGARPFARVHGARLQWGQTSLHGRRDVRRRAPELLDREALAGAHRAPA